MLKIVEKYFPGRPNNNTKREDLRVLGVREWKRSGEKKGVKVEKGEVKVIFIEGTTEKREKKGHIKLSLI